MTSHYSQPIWVEASQLLPAQDQTTKPYPVQWKQQQVHVSTNHDTDFHSQHGYQQQQQYDQEHAVPIPSSTSRPVAKPSFLQRLSGTWLFQLVGLVVSLAALGAIVYVCRRYDGHKIQDWGGLSFNTLIAILAVVSKMAALHGATSAISQLKWVWFTSHNKSLADYMTFDSGSRGVSGAAMLAWSLKGRNFAVVGALAIIIGAAAGPFAQQIVQFYDAEYVDIGRGSAWLSKADILAALGPNLDASTWTADPVFKANAMQAVFLPTQDTLFQPRFNCPTGNCTFPSFTTLGFCPTCADISSELNRTCVMKRDEVMPEPYPICTVSFPKSANTTDPLSLRYVADPDAPGFSVYMVVNATRPDKANVLTNITWPMTVYQSIRAVVNPWELGGHRIPGIQEVNNGVHVLTTDTRFIGSECVLSPCVQRIQASVSKGVYSETILESSNKFVQASYADHIVFTPPWESPSKNFTVIRQWMEAISPSTREILGAQLTGTVETYDSNQAIESKELLLPRDMYSRPNDALQAVFYTDFTNSSCSTPDDNVQCAFMALGKAMTKSVRDAGVVTNGTQDATEKGYVVGGDILSTGTFIRIVWAWLALPAAIWVLSVVTVAVAMWKSRNVPLWRDSALPLVLLFGNGKSDISGGAVREAELAARAETVNVRLVGDEGSGLKIMAREH
ncbi:hypothetical protein QBC35DRAFT_536124 [Podospora australis]|uniref:Uncharacterized protein n=1 Tax=Podospora australis TaxID=1536484 RepID=A0AAN7AEJ5_9PEZI|nr:hypothetical protein QBC35DRAFT_536124 [Podospora australis]